MIELHRDSPRVQSEAIKALALVASTRARGGIADTAERVQTEDQSVPVSCLRAEAVLPGRSPPVPPQSGKLDPAGVESQTQSRASIAQCPEWLKARGTLLAMDIGRRDALKGLHFGSAPLVSSMVSRRDASADVVPNESESDIAVRTAVQGVCAWPNCQILPDGSILALIFNQPCHGLWEGDLDCWASEDGGSTWRFRGRAAQHEKGTNRMNCATGIAADGNVVVLCSGWADRRARGQAGSGPQAAPASLGLPLRRQRPDLDCRRCIPSASTIGNRNRKRAHSIRQHPGRRGRVASGGGLPEKGGFTSPLHAAKS